MLKKVGYTDTLACWKNIETDLKKKIKNVSLESLNGQQLDLDVMRTAFGFFSHEKDLSDEWLKKLIPGAKKQTKAVLNVLTTDNRKGPLFLQDQKNITRWLQADCEMVAFLRAAFSGTGDNGLDLYSEIYPEKKLLGKVSKIIDQSNQFSGEPINQNIMFFYAAPARKKYIESLIKSSGNRFFQDTTKNFLNQLASVDPSDYDLFLHYLESIDPSQPPRLSNAIYYKKGSLLLDQNELDDFRDITRTRDAISAIIFGQDNRVFKEIALDTVARETENICALLVKFNDAARRIEQRILRPTQLTIQLTPKKNNEKNDSPVNFVDFDHLIHQAAVLTKNLQERMDDAGLSFNDLCNDREEFSLDLFEAMSSFVLEHYQEADDFERKMTAVSGKNETNLFFQQDVEKILKDSKQEMMISSLRQKILKADFSPQEKENHMFWGTLESVSTEFLHAVQKDKQKEIACWIECSYKIFSGASALFSKIEKEMKNEEFLPIRFRSLDELSAQYSKNDRKIVRTIVSQAEDLLSPFEKERLMVALCVLVEQGGDTFCEFKKFFLKQTNANNLNFLIKALALVGDGKSFMTSYPENLREKALLSVKLKNHVLKKSEVGRALGLHVFSKTLKNFIKSDLWMDQRSENVLGGKKQSLW